MRFTVTWAPAADDQLAEIWRVAGDKQAVSRACDWIDAILKDDPETKTTPIDNLFALRVDPLTVLMTISPDDRLIEIFQVNYRGKGTK